MKKNKFILVFAFFAMFLSACTTAKVSKVDNKQNILDPTIKVGHLENGMNYYIKENAEPKNRIQLRLVVKTGACMEEDDQKGVAHFIEHMCFNGTEHFEKSAIVDYFESIGMKFGPEVNAETNFEQTVFMLEIPADDEAMLKKSLLVLHDWASAVTFDPVELDKERGVIVEEWRVRKLGLQGRVMDSEVGFIFDGARYKDRLPIGDMNIIKNISRERVMDFYKKWYRPELMSVVLVGDAKTSVLEKAIKEVMSDIPSSNQKIEKPVFEIPVRKNKEICIYKDKEAKYTEIYFFQPRFDNVVIKSEEDRKKLFAFSFGVDIFNQRMQDITIKPDSPWLVGGSGEFNLTSNSADDFIYTIPKAGLVKEALELLINEYEKLYAYGVTDAELERIKQAYLQNIEQNYKNVAKTTSAEYCSNIVNNILTDREILSPEDLYNTNKRVISEITVADVKALFNEYLPNRGTLLYILAPEDAKDLPSKKELMEIWTKDNGKIEEYVEETGGEKIMDKPAVKASIAKKAKIKKFAANEYTFENGVRIITKKTNFEKNAVTIYGVSKGGLFKLDEKQIPSANACINYTIYSGVNGNTFSQLQKFLLTKNLNLNMSLNNTQDIMAGSATKENTEYLLQLMNQFFANPQFTEESWQYLMNNYVQQAQTFGSQPNDLFLQKIMELLFGKTNYHTAFNMDFVNQMDSKTAQKVFKERFANPADFTFIVIGDFNENSMVDLCSYYLGTLKTTKDFEETEYKKFPFPKGIKTAEVKKGIDKQGTVYLAFGGTIPNSKDVELRYQEGELFNQLISLLEIRLREIVREDKSGTYGVSVNGSIDGNKERSFMVEISFACEPEREEELKEAVLAEIENIKAGKFSEENVGKIKETVLRSRENSETYNSWWLNRIVAEYVFNYEPMWVSSDKTKVSTWVTAENLTETAKKYLNTENYVCVFLKPEK